MINGTGDPISGLGTAACGYSVIAATGASMSTVTAADYSLMISKIEEGILRGQGRFMLGRLAMHYTRSLKDSTGQSIYAPMGGQQPGTIWGFPFVQTEKIANTDGTNKLMALFGNFNYAYIGRRAGMSIDVDPYTRFEYDETRFRSISRWALAIANANAFVRLMSAGS
jgi:HK97 family phage major capsid protein